MDDFHVKSMWVPISIVHISPSNEEVQCSTSVFTIQEQCELCSCMTHLYMSIVVNMEGFSILCKVFEV